MVVLVGALISGILFLGDGPGVFAPRATPSTTPKKIKVTNVTDNSFSVSFLTDEATPAFVKYGTSASDLNSQASDDRDQLSGTISDYTMHHITVRGLQEDTTYYYTLGTGSGATFDDGGKPFTIETASRNGAPAAAKTIYGSVSNQSGNPAEGSVVYVTTANAGEMSSLVKQSGSWAIPLSNARTKDGSAYAQITDSDSILISVQGSLPTDTVSFQTTVAQAQPVPTLTFGQTVQAQATASPVAEVSENPSPTPATEPDTYSDEVLDPTQMGQTETQSSEDDDLYANEDPFADLSELESLEGELESDDPYANEESGASQSARTASIQDATQPTPTPITTVDLSKKDEPQNVTTSQPKIVGKAAPNVTVTLQVNSETQINQTVTANENGEFELDIAALSENLEPGDHTVNYSYVDPNTGETISETVSFTVSDDAQQLAQAEPYGSGNPYPPTTPTPTPTPSATPETASESAQASQEAEASDSAEATESARSSMPATDEGIPVSGSVATTLALVFGGLFFIISGLWSFWISHQLAKDEIQF